MGYLRLTVSDVAIAWFFSLTRKLDNILNCLVSQVLILCRNSYA